MITMKISPTSRALTTWRNTSREREKNMLPNCVTTPSLFTRSALTTSLSKGIIIADTKFEFGLDEDGNIVLGDEMLTPDSSRFWPADGYEPGHSQPSFDKQFARDWLTSHPGNDWTLPEDVVQKTIDKYLQSYKMLTGKDRKRTEFNRHAPHNRTPDIPDPRISSSGLLMYSRSLSCTCLCKKIPRIHYFRNSRRSFYYLL